MVNMSRMIPTAGCPGPHLSVGREYGSRREFLRAGLTGFTTLGLAELYHRRALAARPDKQEKTAVILVWLRGG